MADLLAGQGVAVVSGSSHAKVSAERLDQLCAEVARVNRQARRHLREGRHLEAWSALVGLFAVYRIIRDAVEARLADPAEETTVGFESLVPVGMGGGPFLEGERIFPGYL